MTRIAVHRKSEALIPMSPTAKALLSIAVDIGVDLAAIRKAQDKIAITRQQRLGERIAVLEKKIAHLTEKPSETVL